MVGRTTLIDPKRALFVATLEPQGDDRLRKLAETILGSAASVKALPANKLGAEIVAQQPFHIVCIDAKGAGWRLVERLERLAGSNVRLVVSSTPGRTARRVARSTLVAHGKRELEKALSQASSDFRGPRSYTLRVSRGGGDTTTSGVLRRAGWPHHPISIRPNHVETLLELHEWQSIGRDHSRDWGERSSATSYGFATFLPRDGSVEQRVRGVRRYLKNNLPQAWKDDAREIIGSASNGNARGFLLADWVDVVVEGRTTGPLVAFDDEKFEGATSSDFDDIDFDRGEDEERYEEDPFEATSRSAGRSFRKRPA